MKRKSSRKNWDLRSILEDFKRSHNYVHQIRNATYHYADLNSASTCIREAIKKYGFDMIVRTYCETIVIIKKD